MEAHFPWLLDTFRPDLVLYDAGVDPHQEDELGRLRLTDEGEPVIDVSLRSSTVLNFLCSPPRAVSQRSVCDADRSEERRSCCHGYWRGILQRHRQASRQALHRPQSSSSGKMNNDFIKLQFSMLKTE